MINFSKLAQSNTFIKILAFIVAFSLWLYVMSEQNPSIDRVYTINLEKRNVPSELVVMNDQISVRVKVSAARSIMSNVTPSSIRAYVDLTGIEKGTHEKQVFVTVPTELQLLEVAPESVSIVTDSMLTRNFPINVRFDSRLPEELTVRTVTLEPNVVAIHGAESALDKIDQIEAVCIVDSSMASKGQYSMNLVPVARDRNNNLIENITMEPVNVAMVIEVIDNIVTKQVPVHVSYGGTLAEGYRIVGTSVTPDSVTLTGPSEVLQGLNEIYVKEINVDYLNNDFAGPVQLDLPDRVTADAENVEVVLTVAQGQ